MQKDFSYILSVSELPTAEQHYKLKAGKDDLKSLADILKVPDVTYFAAEMNLRYNRDKHLIEIDGHVKADLIRTSVISLEDFKEVHDFDFTSLFDTKATPESHKEEYDDWEDDAPEIVIGGKIDLVTVAVEQVALRMDDYPRKKGEVFEFKAEFSEPAPKHNPFEILSSLKK